MTFAPKAPLNPNKYSFLLPGITYHSHAKVQDLLQKNHEEHDMFYTVSGSHNHLVHQLLTAYALGADANQLQKIFDDHAVYQRSLPPSVSDLTRDNYKEYLGNRDAYTSYLNLFKKEIEQHGMCDTIRRWVFADDMLARTVGGAFHPVIHLGYAIEFDLPSVAAEGLALAACSSGKFSYFLPDHSPVQDTLGKINEYHDTADYTVANLGIGSKPCTNGNHSNGHKSLEQVLKDNAMVQLAEEICKDPDFDDVVSFADKNKLRVVLANEKAVEKLKGYTSRWQVDDSDVQIKLKEMFMASMLVYGAGAIREQGIKLDFFLLHALTSIHAIHSLVPILKPHETADLLRGHAVATLAWYVSRGRPSLQVDLLLKYELSESTKNATNPWLNIFERAIPAPEAHIIKVVRACALGQILYGHECLPLEQAWLKLADMTLTISGGKCDGGRYWNYNGVGFADAWKE
ncbi:hypothetical protein BJV82DRAFT_636920 [Fennellomyces sp. T-0311]|nr:hypothetical protein BJV82DRAFT_636920 [Fennellomyces sp. T-0311]